MSTIRWGILGTGGIARTFAKTLRHTPGALLGAVGSRSLAGAQAFANELDAPSAYGSYQELIDAPDVDIVYIATPHPWHAEHAVMALEGGKAVLCEKPFTMNLREAERVVALARSKRLFLMEAMWTRFNPALAEVRRLIASGEIGVVNHVQADLGFASPADPEHRLNKRELGGGALLDLGIYPLSIACALLGPVSTVQADAVLDEQGTDRTTSFVLRHDSGALSVCACSLRGWMGSTLTVSGTLGQIRMDAPFHAATSVTVRVGAGPLRTAATPFVGSGYMAQAVEAGRCLRAGLLESPVMTHAESLGQMRVLDTIRACIGVRYPADDDCC